MGISFPICRQILTARLSVLSGRKANPALSRKGTAKEPRLSLRKYQLEISLKKFPTC